MILPRGFWERIEVQVNGCWIWTGVPGDHGYGTVQIGGRAGRTMLVHRIMWELLVGPLPPRESGMELDHLCRTRLCCNPILCLELVTKDENARRAGASKTTCIHGHPRTTETMLRRVRATGRVSVECRVCENARQRAKYAASRNRRVTPLTLG